VGEPTGSTDSKARSGLLYGLAAYGWWGLMPLYFELVSAAPPKELLAHRIIWSALLLFLILTLFRRWPEFFRSIRTPRTLRLLALSAALIALNWYVYIYSVLAGQQIQGSLGYFILPLVNVAIGITFFHERLRPMQGVAILLAAAGVIYQIVDLGVFPWIALTLAFSFCLYGVARKQAPVDAVIGLSIETILLAPIALGFVLWWWLAEGTLAFGRLGARVDSLLILSGVVTTVPLLCFAQAVQRLRLITVGFLQYISPSIQLIIAIFHAGEPFTPTHRVSFTLIWAALALFVVDALRANQKRIEYEPREPL